MTRHFSSHYFVAPILLLQHVEWKYKYVPYCIHTISLHRLLGLDLPHVVTNVIIITAIVVVRFVVHVIVLGKFFNVVILQEQG